MASSKPTKKKAKTKPTRKPTKKVAKKLNKPVKPVSTKKSKPASRVSASRPPRVSSIAQSAAAQPARRIEALGTVTCPSGKLSIFDIGLAGFLPHEALEPAIITVEVPADRELAVTGTRVGRGRFADCWDYVTVALGTGEVHASKKLGNAGVDFARLALIDHEAFDHWQHEDSLDGLADVVFWGRDEANLARVLGAKRTSDGYGWFNLPVAAAEERLLDAERKKAANKWLLKTDFRPHSHHFHALAAARANPTGAGSLEIAGSKMLLFFTSWGDGVYPVFLDLDDRNRPVQIRIQLATADSNAGMRAVNR